MATQIKKDDNPISSEPTGISYAGVLSNKGGEGNSEKPKTLKDIKETPVKSPKESKDTFVKMSKEIKNTPKAPIAKQVIPSNKVKNTPTPPLVQEKENIATPSIIIPSSDPKIETDEKKFKDEDIDDADFCMVTARKSKEKRNNAEKHSLVHDRYSRLKKMRRSDSLNNDNWRNHKPVIVSEDKDKEASSSEIKEGVNKEDLVFVEAPIPKVNPWMANKAAAAVVIVKVAEPDTMDNKVLQPKQAEAINKISGEYVFTDLI